MGRPAHTDGGAGRGATFGRPVASQTATIRPAAGVWPGGQPGEGAP
jgi:hypothetical protein